MDIHRCQKYRSIEKIKLSEESKAKKSEYTSILNIVTKNSVRNIFTMIETNLFKIDQVNGQQNT